MPFVPLISPPGAQESPPPSPSLSVQARLPEQMKDATEDKGDLAVKYPPEHQDKHRGKHTSEHLSTHSFCKDGTEPLSHQFADASVQRSPNNDMHHQHARPIGVAAIICAPVQIAKMTDLASLALAHPSVSASALLSTMAPGPDENTDCLNCCELTSSHPPQSTQMVVY